MVDLKDEILFEFISFFIKTLISKLLLLIPLKYFDFIFMLVFTRLLLFNIQIFIQGFKRWAESKNWWYKGSELAKIKNEIVN